MSASVCSKGDGARHLFFNDTATTEIYTLSLHDALPIFACAASEMNREESGQGSHITAIEPYPWRSEEHTSELQSRQYLVCRLLLEKKKYAYEKSLYTADMNGRDASSALDTTTIQIIFAR